MMAETRPLKIGTYYYPEQWPRSQWDRDLDNIVKMGMRIIHMGEFAWFDLEPSPGDFRLDWLDEVIEKSTDRGLDVILCTPTAAPPVWLGELHPETIPTGETGRRHRFGGRRHYSPTSPAMLDASRRIVTEMADRWGRHPAVIGWQIDNEYGNGFDQSPHTHAAFRQWLQRKYGTIEALNVAWGSQFWNTYYTDFAQVLFSPERTPRYDNPHHALDSSRFWSWAFANFNRVQAEVLKPRVGNRFITTNFMPMHPDTNPADFAGDLTLYSWDSYPVGGGEKNPPDQSFRMGDPAGISFTHDQMASYNGRFALMEVQPGQVNWSGSPVRPYPGAVRLWLWTAIAHGAEFVTVYRFRRPLWGIELFHDGLVGTDGVTLSPGGREFAQVASEIAPLNLSAQADATDDEPAVGLLFDFEQLWYYMTLPQAKRWHQGGWIHRWYAAVSRLGLPIRVVHPDRPWPKGLKALVVPGLQMIEQQTVDRLTQFATGGGQLLLTCRTGLMNRHGHLWEGPLAMPIVPLIGANVEGYDTLPEGLQANVSMNGADHKWAVWADEITPHPGTETIATYGDGLFKGTPAVTERKLGSGRVTYCGVYSEPTLVDALAERLTRAAGLPVHPLPHRVQIQRRGKYRIALNFQDATFDVPAPAGATFVVGSRQIGPAGVAVWEEK